MVRVHPMCVDSSIAGKKANSKKELEQYTHALWVHMFRDGNFVCLSTLRVMIVLISGVLCDAYFVLK